MNRQNIVNFESGSVIVTDPCYDIPDSDTDLHQKIISIEPGKYNVEVYRAYNRISELEILKTGINKSCLWEELLSDNIYVPSGQCGFFDINYYKKDQYYTNLNRLSSEIICKEEPFYSICCDRTLSDDRWGVIPHGVVSSTAYGDGIYSLYGMYDKHRSDISRKLVGAVLIFMDEIDDDDI